MGRGGGEGATTLENLVKIILFIFYIIPNIRASVTSEVKNNWM